MAPGGRLPSSARPHAAGSIPPAPPAPPCQSSPQLRGLECPSVESWRGLGPRGGSCDPELGGVQPGASRQGLGGGPGAPWTSLPRWGRRGPGPSSGDSLRGDPAPAREQRPTWEGDAAGWSSCMESLRTLESEVSGAGTLASVALCVFVRGWEQGQATCPLPDLAPRVCFLLVNKCAFLLLSPSQLLYGSSYWR